MGEQQQLETYTLTQHTIYNLYQGYLLQYELVFVLLDEVEFFLAKNHSNNIK